MLNVGTYSTINTILHRNGLTTKEASKAVAPYIRFEKERVNEIQCHTAGKVGTATAQGGGYGAIGVCKFALEFNGGL